MEILRFAKWWWAKLDASGKTLLIVVSLIVLAVVLGVIFGPQGLLVFLGSIILCLILFLVYVLYKATMEKYGEFKLERDKEAQRIVDRLRGI